MRILQVLLCDEVGGAETLARELDKLLTAEGHSASVHYLDSARLGAPRQRLRRFAGTCRAIRRCEPDVVLSHTAIPNVYARLAAVFFSVPCVPVLHSASRDYDSLRWRIAERALGVSTAAVVAVSEARRVEYVSWFPSRAAILSVIPNGLPSVVDGRSSRPDGPLRLIAVSRWAPQKELDVLLTAAQGLCSGQDSLHLTLLGGPTRAHPEYGAHIRIRIEELIASGARISAPGISAQVARDLLTADIFVHASRSEAHPIALIEAAAAGLPIVCTREVAKVSPVEPAATFRAGDAADLARAIREVTTQWPSHLASAEARMTLIKEEFSMKACLERYLAVLAAVIATK